MAGRIPQYFIDDLLNRVDIIDLIDGYVPLKKAGANYKACCPFHNEKSPSFTVSPIKQFYHCFGCGANGSAIGFLMEYDHMEFVEAIEKLASGAGLEVPREHGASPVKKTTNQGIDLYQLMNKANDFYQQQLRQHNEKQQAVDYLKNRGLSGKVAKKFGLGFAPEGWNNLFSALGKTDAEQKALLDTGMLTRNDNDRVYDRFRHRIMFPIHDHRGRVVGFGGRVLENNKNESQAGNPKYLNSPETPIFHKGSELYNLFAARGAIKEANGVLVVEGYMDVVALAQYDINHTVATLGTATTRMHLQRLFRHTQNITFCFDGDRAGKAAAWKALETCLPLMEDGYQISFLFLPDGEDPDSMVQKIGQQGFLELINKATPLTDFLTNHLTQQADLSRLDGRAKLTQLAKPLLNQFPDGILKKLVLERIARLSQVMPNDLSPTPERNTQQTTQHQRKRASTNTLPITPIRRAISLLLQNPQLAHAESLQNGLPLISVKGINLLKILIEQARSSEHLSTAQLLEKHRQETHFNALEKLASHDHILDSSHIEVEFNALLKQLQRLSRDDVLEQLLEKSKQTSLSDREKQELNRLLTDNHSK